MKRFLCCLLIAAMLLGLMPTVFAAETRGVSLTTDSAFFNAFTLSKMPKVQSAVSAGNYTLAKQELLNYYTAKFANYNPIPASPNRSQMVYLASQNAFAFTETYLSYVDVTTTDYAKYQLNLGTNKTGSYVLSMLNKTNGEILIPSSEASSMVPQLIITLADGSTKTLNATADSYVRAGSYASSNYGSATTLYVHDDYSGTTPYSTNTKRVYIKFNTAEIPSNAKNLKLAVYAKRSGTNCESSLRLNVFSAYSTTWTESGITWNWLTNNNQHGHFSWDGISGGFTWTKPSGTPSEWLNYNTRFYEVSSLVQTAVAAGSGSANYTKHLTTAKNLMIDFINNAGAGKPANRSIEPANRLMEFPYIYKHLLASGLLTPAENVKLLAWVYDEAVYMNGGATLFTSSNGVNSAQAYTNHGFWHLAGFYQAFGFFSEFAKASTWRSNYNVRQPIVLSGLLNADGSYNEVTFGYPTEVINWSTVLLTAMSQLGDTSSVASTFKMKLVKLAKYMVDNSQPSGKPPAWGQGGPGTTKTAVTGVLNAIGNTMDNEQIVQELRYYLNHANGVEPAHASEYDDIKVVADRTGWGTNDSMIFMNARCGGNHAHRDANALLLYYNGRDLLADTGMTSYDQNHAHYHFQNSSTDSHNTIEIDGTAQYWTQYLSNTASLGNIDIVSNDGVSNIRAWTKASNTNTHSTSFTHYRNVSYIKGLDSILLVTDKVVPGNSSSHTYRQTWHCAPYSNPSIANDVYDTGKTAYSSGANLIIAQAYNTGNANLNANITATLQTGYDASVPSTTTKYFEYKQTKSGTATYQTVLYPVPAGATATVTPLKLSMLNTADDIALATRIAIEDSSRPNLKVLYHYNSFESTPSTREFGGHTTDASTAMLALNKSSNGAVNFAAISNGSKLYTSAYNLLTVSQKVTDVSVQLDGTTLHIESSDPNISFLTITSNLHAQKVTKVLLNGKEVIFKQAADGTVTVGGLYLLTNFDNGDVFAKTSDWTGSNCTVSVNAQAGLLNGSYSATDPYFRTPATLAYTVKSGDIVEIRIKNTVTSGSYSPLQFFYVTKEHTNYTDSKSVRDTSASYPKDKYVTLQLALPAAAVGQILTGFRIDPINPASGVAATGSYEIDYIYIGPPEYSPMGACTVTFCDAAGKVLDTQGAVSGGSVTYGGATPTKAYDATNHYTFAGWVDANGKTASLTNITSDLTVYASFTAVKHSYTSKVTTAATCTTAGVKTFTCTCGRSYTEAIATTAHSYKLTVISGTCTELGYSYYQCSGCADKQFGDSLRSDGSIAASYVYMGFTEGSLAAQSAHWSVGKNMTVSVDTASGTLSGSITGGDPHIHTNANCAAMNYVIQAGDVVELRMKTQLSTGSPKGIQIFFTTAQSTAYNETYSWKDSSVDHITGEYECIQLTIPEGASYLGQALTSLRIDPVSVLGSAAAQGTYAIDYIYVGPAEKAPSVAVGHSYGAGVITTMPTLTTKGVMTYTCKNDSTHTYTEAIDVLSESLFFDFDNEGYDNAAYGFVNFDDASNWYYYKDVNASSLSVDTAAGTLSVTAVGKLDDTRYPCIYFDTIVNGNYHTYPLNYDPDYAEVLQVRVKFENFTGGEYTNSSGNTVQIGAYMILQYFVDGANQTYTATVENAKISNDQLFGGEYATLTAVLSDAFRAHGKIDKIRVFFGGIESISESKVGKLTVDYVYIGSEAGLPTSNYTVTFLGANGETLATQKVSEGETAVYAGATPTKAADASYHYTFKGWDKALTNVTADITVTAQFTATAHTKVVDKGYAATCLKEGLSDGAHCSVCSYVIAKQTVLPIGDHSLETIPGKAPTCTASGISDGEKCSVCGEITVEQTTVPRLGHSYQCIDNGNGTHSETCIRCDKTTTTAVHTFVNGTCTACGAKETVSAPIYDGDLKFSHSLTLENDISINFIGQGSALNAYDTFYLECKVPVYNGNTLSGYETVNIEPVFNGTNYEFTLTGVTAKMMNNDIEAVFRLTKNGQEYYSKTDVYSVAEYAYGKLDSTKATDTDELKAICANLLRYGAMAQTQFGYRTDALVDASMTTAHKAFLTDLSTVEMTSYMKQLSDHNAPTVPWKSATLELGNKVIMCLIANLANYNGDPSALTMRLTYTDAKGENVTVERPLELYNADAKTYAVSYDGLRATEMRTIVSAAIYLNGTRVSKTVEYSVETYGARNPSDLCRAMLAYGDAANAFFAN